MGVGSAGALGVVRIVDAVEGMHRGISDRWFDALGQFGRVARVPSAATARFVFSSIRTGAGVLGAGIDALAKVERATAERADVWATGLLGGDQDPPGSGMSVRDANGDPIPMGPELASAFPDATGRLVVLVHGLVTTERCWQGTEPGTSLAGVLAGHRDLTPVLIRYDSGRPVADNGARLAGLLEDVHADWPVPIASIALVGHSMGGLVAAHALTGDNAPEWVGKVTDLVTISTPHRGAPLEKLVAAAATGLGVARTTHPLAGFLDGRSRGVKDLGGNRPVATPSQAGALAIRHHVIAGVVTADPTHPLGAILGDLMVRPASSTRPVVIEPTNTVVFGGMNHLGMLRQPAVIDQVVNWVGSPPS